MEIKNWIEDLGSMDEIISEMKKVGENYIKSKNIEARLCADLLYRFALRIEREMENYRKI